MSTEATGTTARAPLSRPRVLAAAVELADEHGVEWLSMRKLASHLGFEVMSLYNHVANKDDLYEGMLEVVSAEIDEPPGGTGWRPELRDLAIGMHRALLRHPWAGALWPRHFPGPNRWRLSEHVLRLLTEGGFAGDLRDLGFHAVTLHVNGFTQQQLSYAADDERSAASFARVAREVSPDEFPLMVDHVRYHQERDAAPGEPPDQFTFVLDLILEGLERARDHR